MEVNIFISRSGPPVPGGYTKCDLKAADGGPRFLVKNQRAWANPTPTPWGRDSEYIVQPVILYLEYS